jgi:DHA1 family chloramphenicol resistance protein-like MFS transporter
LVLTLYGIGALIGITVGGRAADARPFRVLTIGMIGLIIVAAVLALTATMSAPVVIAASAPDVR